MPDLSISIVTADRRLIIPCLQSIHDTTRNLTFEIYVAVNDPKTAGSIEAAILTRFPDTQVVINREAEGFSRSNNRLLRRCRGRYLLLLNDDTVVLPGALEHMVECMDARPEVGAMGCKLLNPDGSPQWSCGRSAVHKLEYFRSGVLRTLLSPLVRDQFFDSVQEVSWVTGACMMVRAEAIGSVGLLDENFYMYYEDGEWCYRIIKAGWKVLYCPQAEVIHYRGQTSRNAPAKTVLSYYESRLYFFSKHFSSATCFIVRTLTICDAILSYFKAVGRKPANRNIAVLRAYIAAIRLAVSYRTG